MTTAEQNLKTLEDELGFLARHLPNIFTDDHEGIQEAAMSVESAKRALREYKQSLQPAAASAPDTLPVAA